MATSAILSIKILTDATGAKKGADEAASSFSKLQGSVNKMAVPAAIAGAALVAFGKSAVDSASRTEQAFGAIDTVFGKSAAQVKAWADGAATSVGLARSEYGELASTLGASLKNMGVPMKDLAGQTDNLIRLGADLSATYGGTTKEAVEALGSALRGETDPIERYGISIKQATIDAEMARRGTDKLTGAAETQAKTQALLGLVTQQSGKAVGAFARESDTAAGSAQISAAQYENLKSTLGTALLPVVALVTAAFGKLSGYAEKHALVIQILAGVVGVLVVGILGLAAALKVYEVVTKAVTVATKLFEAAQKAAWLTAGPVLLVVAIIAIVVAVVVLWKKCAAFRNAVKAIWAGIAAAARAVAGVFKSVWKGAVDSVRGYLAVWKAYFSLVFNVIRGLVKVVVAVFKGDWKGAFDALRGIVSAFRDFFRALFNLLPEPVQKLIDKIKDGLGGAFGWLKDKVTGLGDLLGDPFVTMRDAISDVIDIVKDLISWVSKIKVPDLGGLVDKINPFGAPAPAGYTGAPGVRGLAAGARAGSAGGSGVTFVINGALDPEAVARQIRRILRDHDRRTGNVAAA